jgi:hypothetical protein
MSFDKPRQARFSADQLMPQGERRSSLAALDEAVREHGGMSCGIVPREGTPVLHVINSELPSRSTEIGCDYVDQDWWFTWAKTGDTLGLAEDPAGAAQAVAADLGVHLQAVRP